MEEDFVFCFSEMGDERLEEEEEEKRKEKKRKRERHCEARLL